MIEETSQMLMMAGKYVQEQEWEAALDRIEEYDYLRCRGHDEPINGDLTAKILRDIIKKSS